VEVFFGERRLGTLALDPPEAGMLYHELINRLREHLDERVDFRTGIKAAGFEQMPGGVVVTTDQGEMIECRLVVIATGDARHLLEAMGAAVEQEAPRQVFAVAFDMDGEMRDGRGPVDSQTYHHPVEGTPIAYATFFRLGERLRANIFCQGLVEESLQRELKQGPLGVLGRNRTLAEAARGWRVTSPSMIRKVQVVRLVPPRVPRMVVLGDAAHTIDPAGGGGLTFSLLEVELLLGEYAPHWLREDDLGAKAMGRFYEDARRKEAVRTFFGRGVYIYALNRDTSLKGRLRIGRFALRYMLASRFGSKPAPVKGAGAWNMPTARLYEQASGSAHSVERSM
jgi:2-polyprenyl-6-methoxyphenol hydroxylase-like FAD-dependent oxidoreductase